MSSGPLDDGDVEVLKNTFLKIAVRGTFYGISVILGGLSASILVRQGLRGSISRMLLLAILLVMFLCSTGLMTASIISSIALIRSAGQTPYDPQTIMLKAYIVITVLSRINYALSDAVVVWRAFVLFQHRSLARVVLVISLLISSGAAIIDCAYFIISGIRDADPSPSRYLVLLLPMLFTNVVATVLITWRTWYYHQFETLQDSASGRQIKRVLYLLVESGFLYCIIWILAIVSTQPGGSVGSIAGQSIFAGLVPHLAAIYPTLIIILMSFQNVSSSPGDTVLSRSLHLSEHRPYRDGTGTVGSSTRQEHVLEDNSSFLMFARSPNLKGFNNIKIKPTTTSGRKESGESV